MKNVAEVFAECGKPNWDGYGADAVKESTRDWALAFEKLLPKEFPAPDWDADTDGMVSVEWVNGGHGNSLSISMDETGKCFYAGHINGSSISDTLEPKPRFTKFPKTFQDILRSIYRRK